MSSLCAKTMRMTLGGFPDDMESLLESDEVGFVATRHPGDNEQDLAHRRTAAAGDPLALMLARVASQGTSASLEMVVRG